MAPRRTSIQKAGYSRVFTIEDGAGPGRIPVYQSLARAQSLAWPQGDVTPIRIPDPNQYGRFTIVDTTRGMQGLPSLSIQFRMQHSISDILKIIRKGCPMDIQIHSGVCKDPSDFNKGWDKIQVLETAYPTDYSTDELGAFDADGNVPVNENVPFTALDYYEIKPLVGSEIAAAAIVQRIVDVAICDARSCGECGLPSDGCQRVFAVTLSAGGSPGLAAELIYSQDGGVTIGQMNVTTLAANEDPDAMACVGSDLVIVSVASLSLHYAPITDILNGTLSWVEVGTGFVTAKGPRRIFSLGRTLTWIVGNGGYVYFTEDVGAGVEVQDAGIATVQNLNGIHGFDDENLVAVGASNAVIVTSNGGQTWQSLTGPAVGVALNTVFMRSATEWFVGTANGKLYYTRNSGVTWTERTFPGSGTGSVTDISFPTPTVGYLAHNTTTPRGRVLRSIDGGQSWYVLPEEAGVSLPAGDAIDTIAACADDPNVVYAGGLADNAIDGILMKIA